MKTTHATILALSFSAGFGNGQESVPPPPPDGYGIQGNVVWNKALQASELDRAALAARQKKALMQSMATVAHRPPVITSAEQYLQVHRPPTPPPGESASAPSPVRRDTYVPAFENASPTVRPEQGSTPVAELPRKRPSLFPLFRGKREGEQSGGFLPGPAEPEMAPPTTSYPEPASPETVGSAHPPTAAQAIDRPSPELLAEATRNEGPNEKPSFFGRLFSREKGAATPEPVAEGLGASPAFPDPASPMEAPVDPPLPVSGIPSPPSFDGPAAPVSLAPAPAALPANESASETVPPPASEGGSGSSIFVRRTATPADGENRVVRAATKATVDGVLVTLHKGTEVAVLERRGSLARIRLPDQREGTVAASALGL